jgi:hypothetical protein
MHTTVLKENIEPSRQLRTGGTGSKETAMATRRFERIAVALLLVAGCVVFGDFGLIEHARAQYVPPPTPLPPPVLNPSSPYTVPQPSYTPLQPSAPSTTPSTLSTVPSGEVAPANEKPARRSARSEREASVAKTRSVHHHRGRFAGPTLGSYYCGYTPCVRIYPRAFYSYAAPVVAPARVDTASALWWPGYYDYAPGEWAHGRPRYGGYGRRAGYHGD